MTRVRLLVLAGIVVAVLLAGVLALPVKQKCPKGPCITAPDEHGNIHYYYEVKPLGLAFIDGVTGSNFPFHYSSGHDVEKVR